MKEINKNNLLDFMELYHNFHDSLILNSNYDIKKSQIELIIDVYWKGETQEKEDGTCDTHKTKMRMIFVGVEKCNNKEIFTWDFLHHAYMKYIKLDNKEFICFASDEEDPFIYIVCDRIAYEEI